VQGSREASTYVYLSGRDTYRAILEMHGLAETMAELNTKVILDVSEDDGV